MRTIPYIVGELLFLANSRPPIWKQEFYELKDKIIKRYGTPAGFDVQHIRKECYECEGTGKILKTVMLYGEPWLGKGASCWKCNETGVYTEFWTHLLRFRVGRRLFHQPEKKYCSDPEMNLQRPMIEGYVEHKTPKYYLNAEAFYWLALIFDTRLFYKHFGHVGHLSRKFTPLVVLGTFVFWMRHLKSDIKFRMWKFRESRRSVTPDDDMPF